MIPGSEWTFFEGMEQRLKHLERHHQETEWARLQGQAPPWDPAELVVRRASLVQEMDYAERVEAAAATETDPDRVRHLQIHRRGMVAILLETHPDLAPLIDTFRERRAELRPRIAGEPVSWAERDRVLLQSPERDTREAAHRALEEPGASFRDDALELIRRREALSRAVAEIGFPALAFHVQEQERAETVGLLDEVERYTRTAFQEIRAAVIGDLRLQDGEPWDLGFGVARELPPDELFPAGEMVGAARSLARAWGLEPEGGIRVEVADVPEGARAFLVEPPDDVRVLHRPASGLPAWHAFFRAYGTALAAGHVRTRRHYLERVSPVLETAAGLVFASALLSPPALRTLRPESRIEPSALDAFRRLRILRLRREAAWVAFENIVYARSSVDPEHLLADVNEQLLHETRRRDSSWAADFGLLIDPLRRASSLVGEVAAAQIAARLAETVPEWWAGTPTGDWLRDGWFAGGARVPWDVLVEQISGAPPTIAPLAAHLGVSFSGPTLTEAEGVSDEAAADYFKDIDLSDLDLD